MFQHSKIVEIGIPRDRLQMQAVLIFAGMSFRRCFPRSACRQHLSNHDVIPMSVSFGALWTEVVPPVQDSEILPEIYCLSVYLDRGLGVD